MAVLQNCEKSKQVKEIATTRNFEQKSGNPLLRGSPLDNLLTTTTPR